jgi:GT2 family glycosyltransferase
VPGWWWLVGLSLLAAFAPYAAEAMYAARVAGAIARGCGVAASGSAWPGTGTARRAPAAGAASPTVSVVVAARDEAASIGATVSALQAQDHPALEIVLVDDRSTDGTGDLMDALAASGRQGARPAPGPPPIRVVRVRDLPPGWLGKNHALWRGARLARGRWLLFTDADVRLHPAAVGAAVRFAEERRLDHLALGPALTARGFGLQAWVSVGLLTILTFLSPRSMNRPSSRRGYGVGAFNLVRRSAYEAIGTHRAIALRPDDDVRLGLRLRRAGFRQWAAAEPALARVEWYGSLGEAIRGLEKNAFAVLNYRPAVLALAVAGTAALFVGPCVGAALVPGPAAWVFRADVAVQWATVATVSALFVVPGRPARAAAVALAYPWAALVFAYAMARSGWLALARGSVEWRGTRYDLGALRSQTGQGAGGGSGPNGRRRPFRQRRP